MPSSSPYDAAAGDLGEAAGAAGTRRHAGMFTGETVSQLRVIGPAEPTPTHATRTPWRLGGVELLLDDPGERLEVGLGTDVLVDEHDGAVEQLAARRDQAGGELGAADVDGEHDRRQLAGAARDLGRRRIGRRVGDVVGRRWSWRLVGFVRIQTISRQG